MALKQLQISFIRIICDFCIYYHNLWLQNINKHKKGKLHMPMYTKILDEITSKDQYQVCTENCKQDPPEMSNQN